MPGLRAYQLYRFSFNVPFLHENQCSRRYFPMEMRTAQKVPLIAQTKTGKLDPHEGTRQNPYHSMRLHHAVHAGCISGNPASAPWDKNKHAKSRKAACPGMPISIKRSFFRA
jgi:hypothetical protein